MHIFLRLIARLHAADVSYPPDNDADRVFSFRSFLLLLSLWLVLWTLLPSLCIGNIPIDVAENVAWGQSFDFGYDKNPYLGAWLTAAVFRLFPYDWVFYLMSQLAVFTGLAAAYLLAFETTRSRSAAFIAGVLSLLIPFFSHSANEFNDDVISIALWGLTALWFHRAVRRGTIGAWLAAGIFAGAALMTKYLAGALLLPLGVLLFVTREGRSCWKKPGVYLGAAVFLLLIAPNVAWLLAHDFIAVRYAFGRAELLEGAQWSAHFIHPAELVRDFFSRLILPAAAILLFRRSKHRADDGFDRAVMRSAAAGPFVLSFVFSLATGGDVLTSWLTPYFVFAAPLLVMEYRPVPEKRPLRLFFSLFVASAVIMTSFFGYEYLCKRPYLKRSGGYNVYPGRPVAEELTRRWRERFRRPVPYVIGDRTSCCYMNYYSPDRPRVFFDHDTGISPSIDPDDVAKRGAVVIWRWGEPRYLKQYSGRLVEKIVITREREIPRWLRAIAGAPSLITVNAMFVTPRDETPNPRSQLRPRPVAEGGLHLGKRTAAEKTAVRRQR